MGPCEGPVSTVWLTVVTILSDITDASVAAGHSLGPIIVDHIFKDKISQTRTGSGQFTLQHIAVNKDIYANSVYPWTILEWNSSTMNVRTASSAEEFKFKLHKWISTASTRTHIINCWSPHHLHVNIH